ncbi:MAG: InlB B-repeat-containing protein [Treponema sp.]|jgi:uncharacterized repeat protein (TIGR02543 family)|nr:InlB B-repeat-containing protein [Treponema sp.]
MSVFTKKLSGASPAAAVLLAAFAALVVFAVFAAGILSSCGGGGGGGGVETYSVAVTTGLTGGSLAVDKLSAAVGAAVTITVTPDEDYTLTNGSLKVKYGSPEQVISPAYISGSETTRLCRFTMPAADVTVTAAFEQVPAGNHLIAVSVPNGHGAVTSSVSSVDVSSAAKDASVTLTIAPDTGYQLKTITATKTGDTTTVSLSGGGNTRTFTMPDYDVTVTAEFEAKTYTITYTLYDGVNPGSPPATYTIESPDITLPTPTRTNCIFEGWYIDAGFTGDAVTKIPAGSTGDKTFYAKWHGTVKFTYINSKYNGQFAVFRSSESTPPTEDDYLIGAGGFADSNLTGVRISGGSVTIPVYLGNTTGGGTITGPYSGTDSDITIYLIIKDGPSFARTSDLDNRGTYTIPGVDFAGGASVNIATDTVPKTLKITGINMHSPAEDVADAMIGIFEKGISGEDMSGLFQRFMNNTRTSEHQLRQMGFIAGARYKPAMGYTDLKFAGTTMNWTATAQFHLTEIPPKKNGPPWTGYGEYDVYFIWINLQGDTFVYQKTNVNFNNATITVVWDDFE